MRLTAFFKFYKICTLLHRSTISMLAKNQFWTSAIHFFHEISAFFVAKSILQNLQILRYDFLQFLKFQLDNLVNFKKCWETRINSQRSVPIQPKTNNILPKFCQNWQLPYGSSRKTLARTCRSDAECSQSERL